MHAMWEHFQKSIRDHVAKTGDIWSCPEFNQTMFYSSNEHIYEKIQLCEEVFGPQTKSVLEYDKMPSSNIGGFKTNTNTVHQAYHLATFIKNGGDISVDTITEFGAGYGELCRIITTLNPKVRYNIIDLPTLCDIQRWYLDYNNVHWNTDSSECDLFIAMWSLSEVPEEEREQYLGVKARQFMFAFGDEFFSISNVKYFFGFMYNNRDLDWEKIDHPYLQNQYYFLGV